LFTKVVNGATTLWESWPGYEDPSDPGHPSHNHHFLGGIGQWFVQGLVGVSMTGVGWASIDMAPDVTSDPRLSGGAATLSTVRGEVFCSWSHGPAEFAFTINASIPPGSQGTVTVQVTTVAAAVTEGGRPVWQHGNFVPGTPGVVGAAVVAGGKGIQFAILSGVYEFASAAAVSVPLP